MRIRTIKPEFWSHRMHQVISETSALVALGLLNIADDDGRFLDNPRSIEAVIFPLRPPKKKMAACLAELEGVGFMVRYTAVMDGHRTALGVLPGFRKHQVINRPQVSRLAPPPVMDHSLNGHGIITDDSRLTPVMEGKGREGKGKEVAAAVVSSVTSAPPKPPPPPPPDVQPGEDIFDQALPIVVGSAPEPRRKTLGDLEAMNPRLLVMREDRQGMETTLALYGWDPCVHGLRTLAVPALMREPGKQRILVSELRTWLGKEYRLGPDDYRNAGLPDPGAT